MILAARTARALGRTRARSRGSATLPRSALWRWPRRSDRRSRPHRAPGIRTLRYPVLWETISPDRPDAADWSWHDEPRPLSTTRDPSRSPACCAMGIRPATPASSIRISPPVARHANGRSGYPDLDLSRPVNEPLTARLRRSSLSGTRTDARGFPRAPREPVLGDGARHAGDPASSPMRARADGRHGRNLLDAASPIRPISRTSALARLRSRSADRSTAAIPVACSAISAWRRTISRSPRGEAAPDIIGINHYLTSERFSTSAWTAIRRTCGAATAGIGTRTRGRARAVPAGDLSQRAPARGLGDATVCPVAVTEAHHGCTRASNCAGSSRCGATVAESSPRGPTSRFRRRSGSAHASLEPAASPSATALRIRRVPFDVRGPRRAGRRSRRSDVALALRRSRPRSPGHSTRPEQLVEARHPLLRAPHRRQASAVRRPAPAA